MLNLYSLEQHIEAQMKAARIPGFALAIVKDQEVVYAKGFGVTSVEDGGLPVTPQTLFRIGSTTKPLTGTAVMRLVEDGKLNLDRPVREYVDWLTFSEEGAIDRVTLRMLMSHTAGLPTAAEHFGPRDPGGLAARIREEIPTYPLIAPPGKLFSYSNPGVNLVGYIAEVVSGKPYAELMQELVFDQLEMKRTTFDPTVAMTYPLAQSHDLNEDGTLRTQHRFAENTAGYPSGFALSTVLDLSNFAIMQMNSGRFHDKQVLSPESVAEMHKIQVDLYTTTGTGYGLTFGNDTYKGISLVEHNGAISSFGSQFVMIPNAGVAIVILFNRTTPDFAAETIVHRILDQLLDLPEEAAKPQAIEPERSLWPLYIGDYLGQYNGLASIQDEGDRLTLDFNGTLVPLNALRKDLYFGQKPDSEETVSVGFVPEEASPTRYIIVDGTPYGRIERDSSFVPDSLAWKAYVGTYTGVFPLETFIKDGCLYVDFTFFHQKLSCTPLDNTRFVCERGLIEFQMADEGAVSTLIWGKSFTFTRVHEM